MCDANGDRLSTTFHLPQVRSVAIKTITSRHPVLLLMSSLMYSSTRGHDLKIQKQCAAVDTFKYNFPNRIIGVWNELPDCVVKASTCFIFRRLVDGLDLQKYCLVCD